MAGQTAERMIGRKGTRTVRNPRLDHWMRAEYQRLSTATDMPPATHSGIQVVRDLQVPVPGSAALLADHWAAARGAGGTTVLIRTPYGRRGAGGIARFLAERGHHVLVQSCRGTFDSGGPDASFEPMRHEVADGQATMRWLRAQPWATGAIQSWGFSYVGMTQWALCDGPDRPDAMVVGLSARRFDEEMIYLGGGFGMEAAVTWNYSLDLQQRAKPVAFLRLLRAKGAVARACLVLPPRDAVRAAIGRESEFYQDWLEHSEPGDPWWQPYHFASDPATVPPVTILAGWQDLFLTGGFHDYAELRAAGRPLRLIAGDWTHHGPDAGVVAAREVLRQFDDLALTQRTPVAVELTDAGGWHDLDAWPPPSTVQSWMLGQDGALATDNPAGGQVQYRYDPADPTPQAGGRSLNPFVSGRRDQRAREERSDVVLFTSSPLTTDLTVAGDIEVELTFTSSNPQVDFFLRLCDVAPAAGGLPGDSATITDGYTRLAPPAEPGDRRTVHVRLSPTAHRFPAGHRIRLQVSSGAHPLHLRNSGTTDPLHDFSRLVPSDQTVYLGGDRPSVLKLPVVTFNDQGADHP